MVAVDVHIVLWCVQDLSWYSKINIFTTTATMIFLI